MSVKLLCVGRWGNGGVLCTTLIFPKHTEQHLIQHGGLDTHAERKEGERNKKDREGRERKKERREGRGKQERKRRGGSKDRSKKIKGTEKEGKNKDSG